MIHGLEQTQIPRSVVWVGADKERRPVSGCFEAAAPCAHTGERAPQSSLRWGREGANIVGKLCVFWFCFFFHKQGYILFSVSECEPLRLLSVQGSSKSVVAIKETELQSLFKTEGNMAAC